MWHKEKLMWHKPLELVVEWLDRVVSQPMVFQRNNWAILHSQSEVLLKAKWQKVLVDQNHHQNNTKVCQMPKNYYSERLSLREQVSL